MGRQPPSATPPQTSESLPISLSPYTTSNLDKLDLTRSNDHHQKPRSVVVLQVDTPFR